MEIVFASCLVCIHEPLQISRHNMYSRASCFGRLWVFGLSRSAKEPEPPALQRPYQDLQKYIKDGLYPQTEGLRAMTLSTLEAQVDLDPEA